MKSIKLMPIKLFDFRMNDGSRNFADLPENVFFDKLRECVSTFSGAKEIGFVMDWITEVWLYFEFRWEIFSINNQFGDYWFFCQKPGLSG